MCLLRLSALLAVIFHLATSTSTPIPRDILVRLPPSLDPTANTSGHPKFTLPPPYWQSGNWKVTYTSSASYRTLINMQFDSCPILPGCAAPSPSACPPGTFPGQLVDQTSYNLPNTTADSSVINTAFGYDTPRRLNEPSLGPGWNGVYDFHGTGPLDSTTNSWERVAWGEDENGDDWWVLYETPATGPSPQAAAISVESRVETGPTQAVLGGVKEN